MSLTHSPTHALTHSLTHSLTHPPTHARTHARTRSLTHYARARRIDLAHAYQGLQRFEQLQTRVKAGAYGPPNNSAFKGGLAQAYQHLTGEDVRP